MRNVYLIITFGLKPKYVDFRNSNPIIVVSICNCYLYPIRKNVPFEYLLWIDQNNIAYYYQCRSEDTRFAVIDIFCKIPLGTVCNANTRSFDHHQEKSRFYRRYNVPFQPNLFALHKTLTRFCNIWYISLSCVNLIKHLIAFSVQAFTTILIEQFFLSWILMGFCLSLSLI